MEADVSHINCANEAVLHHPQPAVLNLPQSTEIIPINILGNALKNERCFIESERVVIQRLFQELGHCSQELMQTSWLWKKRQRDICQQVKLKFSLEDHIKKCMEIRQTSSIYISDGLNLKKKIYITCRKLKTFSPYCIVTQDLWLEV